MKWMNKYTHIYIYTYIYSQVCEAILAIVLDLLFCNAKLMVVQMGPGPNEPQQSINVGLQNH